MSLQDIAHKIRNSEELTEEEKIRVEKLLMIIGQDLYTMSDTMFISGYSGDMGTDGLPQWLFVCPTYGADHRCTAMYKKQKRKEKI
jgi:hypothetical protein